METLRDVYVENTWMLTIFLIVLGTATLRFVFKLLLDRIERHVRDSKNLWDDAVVFSSRKPGGWAIWLIGLSFAGETILEQTNAELFTLVPKLREAGVIILLAWFVIRLISEVQKNIIEASARIDAKDRRWDETTANIVGKILRASILITAFLILLQTFGFSIQAVLAFGGIGGIAIGFAARDMLANFFGALMLFIDKPFGVDDWIRSPDQEIEGTVEEIGWRITRIRTFDQRPLYVPNSTFLSLSVENPSRMLNRRIYETIGVRYDDVGVVAVIVRDIRDMLINHEEIDTERTLMVNVVSYGESAVEFFIYTFTKTTVWTEFHEIKEDVLLKVADIIHSHGAEFAFPTRTLHLPNFEPEPSTA